MIHEVTTMDRSHLHQRRRSIRTGPTFERSLQGKSTNRRPKVGQICYEESFLINKYGTSEAVNNMANLYSPPFL